jgi:hypothetical protein
MTTLRLADLEVTNVATPVSSTCIAGISNDDGLLVLGWYNGALGTTAPTTASVFAPGCVLFVKQGTSSTTNIVVNSGTTASVVWTAKTIN